MLMVIIISNKDLVNISLKFIKKEILAGLSL